MESSLGLTRQMQMHKYTLVRLEMTLLVSQSSDVGVLWLVHSSDCVCPHEVYKARAYILRRCCCCAATDCKVLSMYFGDVP